MVKMLIEAARCWTLPVCPCIIGGVDGRGIICGVAIHGSGMERFWQAGAEQLILSLTILAIMVSIAYYVIGRIRPKPLQKEQKEHEVSQWLSKFREMHSEGELSDEEFRTIKTTLPPELQEELNDNGKKG